MGLGHLLSIREPATGGLGEAVGSRAERDGSGGSSLKRVPTTGERSGEQSRRSRGPVPSKSIAAPTEPNEGEGEWVEGQHMPGQESLGVEIGAASESGQAHTRGGPSSEGGGAAAGEATVEQVDQR